MINMDLKSCFDQVELEYGLDFDFEKEQSEILNVTINDKKNIEINTK